MTQATLTIDELSGVFKALRGEENDATLQQALADVIALAKAKGMNASQFAAVLEGAGVELTDNFQQWLDQQFDEGK